MKRTSLIIERMKKNITQTELAEIIGVSRQTIHLIEQGNYNPTLRLCILICDALDVTLNDIFWNEQEITNSKEK